MTTASLERVTCLLGGVGSRQAFTARRAAEVADLRLEVKGIGPIALPISPAQARKLSRLGRPAPYGRGEQTLFDRRVRDTSRVPKSRVKIDGRRWNRTLQPMLDSLRADLGLPDGARLKAELHDLLVYGRGQFFAPHQDSEKADAMVGTLVVMLPSTFRGGALVVEHQGEEVTYRGSKERLTFVAFYADCLHQVRPVRSGHRIVLTYNLRLASELPDPHRPVELEPATVEALGGALREHLTTPLPARRWHGKGGKAPPRRPPNRLVYLLDHQYTERGLAWKRLKGSDASRAAALRDAAEVADCEVALALAEVHEVWGCFEPGWNDSGPWRHRRWERDADDDWFEAEPVLDGPDAYELDDLQVSEIRLDRWIGPTEREISPIVTDVGSEEVCSSTPSSELEPYASEYEGYMGNYGNTMDRWYRRAAVVVWPRERAFAVRAEASPAWALAELLGLVRAGRQAKARDRAAALTGFWEHAVSRQEDGNLFRTALEVADGLDEPPLAESLLLPFRVEELTPRGGRALVALAGHYGEAWTRRLLEEWSGHRARRDWSSSENQLRWIAGLPRLCRSLCSAEDVVGRRVAWALLRDRWSYLREEVASSLRLGRPSQRRSAIAKLSEPLLGLLESAGVAEALELRDEVIAFLCTGGAGGGETEEAALGCVVQLLRAAERGQKKSPAAGPLKALGIHAKRLLKERLERPERSSSDWSMPLPEGCCCERCRELEEFLSDPSQRRLEWPLAKEGRRHVHRRIDEHELPVRHETRRTGRPFTLVLTKTEALFEEEARARRSWRNDLEWLGARLD